MRRGLARASFLLGAALCVGMATVSLHPSRGAQNAAVQSAPAPTDQTKESSPSCRETDEEAKALDEAVTSASHNPQAVIRNLQDFLARFPESQRRKQVLRTVLRLAIQSNDPGTAVAATEKLLEASPADPALLSTVVELLNRQNDSASREKAIQYATRLIQRADKLAREPKPLEVSAEKWEQNQVMLRAEAYLARGKAYADSGENGKAIADFERSYDAYPSAQVAERIGDAAAKGGSNGRAIESYATAFAFPERNADPAHREQVRKKLSRIYVAKYHSEKGLGDLILRRYDELMRRFQSRDTAEDAANTGVHDPYEFAMKRLDGPTLRLADYHGKVVVMDFWATWCGPCRVEGKLFENVVGKFRKDQGVAFLAVNVDEDRNGVPDFIKEQRWTVPVVYGQGLDQMLGVRALPTLVIFDRDARVVFRQEGIDPSSFEKTLEDRLTEVLGPGPGPASPGFH